ncbi:protein S40-1-like [Musa acuminata AAA Group]|uniref:protein S40-1-like n=1 Tax=Musa acuminata AAA Group TaxID=214697 RepID=UPI0031DCC95D
MEEFDEADVLWPDDARGADELAEQQHSRRGSRQKASSPVEIPSRPRAAHRTIRDGGDDAKSSSGDGDDDGSGDHRVPPHIIVARRKTTFSVCVGDGRTLKGRELCHVRNSILRMTGFLER